MGIFRTIAFVGTVLAGLLPAQANAAESAVVLTYHRFADDRYPNANTRLDQLDAHIQELTLGGYTVLPLPTIIDALQSHRPLPDKTVAITIDESWSSLYQQAWPKFLAAGLPITLFIATDETDRGGDDFMTWAQVRDMVSSGLVSIGSLGASYGHWPSLGAAALADDLTRAKTRFEIELGKSPTLFAWPYGEMSRDMVQTVQTAGFRAAFGQHSGAVWPGADMMYLPRFTLNETYGEPERFRMAARTIPLTATDITPADPKITVNPPVFGFTVGQEFPGLDNLACYTSHDGRAALERLGPRIEVRMNKPLPRGRSRLNCTAPSLNGRWHWFGWQFYVP